MSKAKKKPIKKKLTGKYWQYRVMAHEEDNGEVYFKIHEVYFKANGNIDGYSERGASIGGETIESLKDMLSKAYLMVLAIGSEQPKYRIIWAGKKFPSYYKQ